MNDGERNKGGGMKTRKSLRVHFVFQVIYVLSEKAYFDNHSADFRQDTGLGGTCHVMEICCTRSPRGFLSKLDSPIFRLCAQIVWFLAEQTISHTIFPLPFVSISLEELASGGNDAAKHSDLLRKLDNRDTRGGVAVTMMVVELDRTVRDRRTRTPRKGDYTT